METKPFRLRTQDHAVSPVVGTILMVAVTVALGATVLAIMSGVGSDKVQENTNAVFQATGLDTDNDGKTDSIRVTYISGPNVDVADVSVRIGATNPSLPVTDTTWNPGDFIVQDGVAGSNVVTVSALSTTVVDQNIVLDE